MKTDALAAALAAALGDKASVTTSLGEVTAVIGAAELRATMRSLRDRPELRFELLVDVSGLDYSTYGMAGSGAQAGSGDDAAQPVAGGKHGGRFAVAYHLLSVANNWRLRVRVLAPDDDFPVVPSVIDIWPSAGWYEREAFDLFGIVFAGHPDLRRILTDYGFVGHPFRKDFPLSGHVEMRYDPDQGRVIYQPITIEPREVTPRIIRENLYADSE